MSDGAATTQPIITIAGLGKTYASGFQALKNIDLEIRRGEIFALLGPNGAGKTTLISIVCGIVRPGEGTVLADGFDIVTAWRAARSRIGLVPQELTTDLFATVWATTCFSRGLFGKPANPEHIERVLKALSLWDRRNDRIMTLSGGMKRRVMIAKALAHEPRILFLDEPTAGVDVELRRDMWEMVRSLRAEGVTIILTTHYIEEAEEMADRIGVISKGELILVEEKAMLMQKLGRKRLTLAVAGPAEQHPGCAGRMAAGAFRGWQRADLYLRHAGSADRHQRTAGRARRGGAAVPRPAHIAKHAGRDLRRAGERTAMNLHAVRVIYMSEMARTRRTLVQSIVSPVISTSLYFVVFGASLGSRIHAIDGVSYGAFIVPGLIMLSLLTQSISNASIAIYFPKFVGTIYEMLSAPVSAMEIAISFVGAAATKSIAIGLIILAPRLCSCRCASSTRSGWCCSCC